MEAIKASAGEFRSQIGPHALFLLVVASLALLIPSAEWRRFDQGLVWFLGGIALWRYGWWLLHFLRSQLYLRVVFPRLRRQAEESGSVAVPEFYFVVTSFRIDSDTTARVYASAFAAARRSGVPTTVIASIVEMGDQRLIKRLFELCVEPGDQVRLVFVRIAGTGKRDALASAFRAISRRNPDPRAVVAVIDGDSMVPSDLIARTGGFFQSMPRMGALTTDEQCVVEGRRVFREWYSLRFAQRQVLMCSMGLSRRVLTLTGRMSMFRVSIVCDPSFIRQVENDQVDHWRLGKFEFLTGDDKSTWYWLLARGYHMAYVPDVVVETVEQPPVDHFVPAAAMLMVRWFGNMLRTNARAVRLGPKRIGLFTWWCILDQRISMWTSLLGPVVALLVTVFVTPFAVLAYLVWIAFSRWIMSILLLCVRPVTSITYPFFLFFNQVFGAIVKIYILFRLDKQKWTRQKTTSRRSITGLRARMNAWSSTGLHALSISLFVYVLAILVGILDAPQYDWFTE